MEYVITSRPFHKFPVSCICVKTDGFYARTRIFRTGARKPCVRLPAQNNWNFMKRACALFKC